MKRKVIYWLIFGALAFTTFNSDMSQAEKTAFGHLLSVWIIFGISVSASANSIASHFQKIKYIFIGALVLAVFAYGSDADDDEHRKQKTIGVIAKVLIGGYAGVLTKEYLDKPKSPTDNQ
jgi:hypothetical protein